MRTLFGKIFTWYLLATIAIVSVVAITMLIVRENLDESRFRSVGPAILEDYPRALIRALEEGRPQDLEAIKTSKRVLRSPVYVFAESGKQLLGRPATKSIDQLFQRTRDSHQIEVVHMPLSSYVARYFVADNGKGYILVYALARVRPIITLFLRAAWLYIALFLAIIAVLCWALARQLTAPILAVGSALSRLAHGDLGARIESKRFLSGPKELALLARSFNFMAERMDTLVGAQRRLIADAAHELGSPLTRLNVALGIAQRRVPAIALPCLDRIEDEMDRVHYILQQLLTLAQLDASPQAAATELIYLPDLLSEVVNDCDFEAQAHSRRVKIECSEECCVSGTRELLRSAIENVIRNGIRYTDLHTEVNVSLRMHREMRSAAITIRDHGPGVPEEALKPMFEPFYRLRDRLEKNPGGTGLGLAITSRAIAAHRGAIAAANAVGGGLEVRIELPVTE